MLTLFQNQLPLELLNAFGNFENINKKYWYDNLGGFFAKY